MQEDNIFILMDEDENQLGSYDQIDHTIGILSANGYGACFFTKKKNFGLNATISLNWKLKEIDNVNVKDSYTILFGPIFRAVKDGKTTVSFGIDIGWDQAVFSERAEKDFTGRVRLGIPFGIYKKDKKTEKN